MSARRWIVADLDIESYLARITYVMKDKKGVVLALGE